MVTIRVLGTGCPGCNELEQMCFNVLGQYNIDADMQKITDIKKIAEFGVMSTPALIINGKTYCTGKIPTKQTLTHWIMGSNK